MITRSAVSAWWAAWKWVAILAGLLSVSLWLNVRQYGDRREAAAAARAATLEDTLEVTAGIARQAQSDSGQLLQRLLAKIRDFNRVNPELAITSSGLQQSIKNRARYSARAEAGIILNPKLAARLNKAVTE